MSSLSGSVPSTRIAGMSPLHVACLSPGIFSSTCFDVRQNGQ